MRIRFLFLILFGSILAVAVYVLLQSAAHLYVTNVYQSEEKRIERELRYVEDLQDFVTSNKITYDNVDDISRWMNEHRFVYLLIYKDDEIIFRPEDEEENEGGEGTDENGTEGGAADGSQGELENGSQGSSGEADSDGEEEKSPSQGGESENGGAEDEAPDGEGAEGNGSTEGNGGAEGELPDASDGENTDQAPEQEDGKDGSDKKEENTPPSSKPGGITVDYPTKEELYEYARAGESYPLILTDGGSLSCSLAEYTEYFYYDMSNIVSFALALLALAIILVVYFYKVTSRIARLAKDVSTVSAGAMNHTIRAGKNRDEITTLCRNVEQMRSSIVETLEKERAAVNANAELITSMSHDIRTPLTVLLGYLDIMGAETQDAELLQYIQSAKQTANRLKNLSDEMFQYFLVFSEEQSPMQCERYEAKTLLSQFFLEHALLLEEKGYRIVPHVRDGFLSEQTYLFTNAPGCMRIVDNIFSNLSKYADRQDAVHVYLHEDDERVYIEIENTVRADKESVESTGIGLRTCERIAKNTGMLFDKDDGCDTFRVTLGIPKAKGDEE